MIQIVTDSSCDLPPELAEKYNVSIVPLTIRFGEQEFIDRDQLSPDEFWKKITNDSELPKTAAPSPGAFEKTFREAFDNGAEGVLCLTLSSKLSATYQAAVIASEAVKNSIDVRVIDTLSLTTALGMLAVHASEKSGGESLDGLERHIKSLLPNIRIYATLDTLEFLKKGGRIGGAQAFLGNLLSIKPVIAINDGEVHAETKQRTRSRAIDYLYSKVTQATNPQQITVCSGLAGDAASFANRIREALPNSSVVESTIGPVIGTYGGPGVVGVTYVEQTP
jgi:DegV family protein with EDD domain